MTRLTRPRQSHHFSTRRAMTPTVTSVSVADLQPEPAIMAVRQPGLAHLTTWNADTWSRRPTRHILCLHSTEVGE